MRSCLWRRQQTRALRRRLVALGKAAGRRQHADAASHSHSGRAGSVRTPPPASRRECALLPGLFVSSMPAGFIVARPSRPTGDTMAPRCMLPQMRPMRTQDADGDLRGVTTLCSAHGRAAPPPARRALSAAFYSAVCPPAAGHTISSADAPRSHFSPSTSTRPPLIPLPLARTSSPPSSGHTPTSNKNKGRAGAVEVG
ncbi:hypothetical protein B0H10DRAFT_2230167 [Mycena sp. CBHHK59/15]|nr:hypothetical protein B0H10DRAFT_2230167 [Mycena sp. CBHHK59/15]